MSRVIYAMDEFDRQKPIDSNMKIEQKLADRIAIRHKIGARWDANDEIEFFDLEEGQVAGMVTSEN